VGDKKTKEWTAKFIETRCQEIIEKLLPFSNNTLQKDFVAERIQKQLRQRFDSEFVDFHDVRSTQQLVETVFEQQKEEIKE